MISSLPTSEFECHVVVPDQPPLRAQLEAAGARVHIVPMRRITGSATPVYWLAYALAWPVTVWRIAALIRTLRIDVVHSNSLHSWYGWAAAALTRKPHVWSAREIVVQSGAALTLERFLVKHFAATTVAISTAVANQLEPGSVRIYSEAPTLPSAQKGSFRTKHGISDDTILVGAAGRLDTWKGFDVLLDAWPLAAIDGELVIAGGEVEGKERYADALRSRPTTRVRFVGELDDMSSFYADIDLFVMPSTLPEPLGLVMIEALMSGTPVLATDHGGPPDILTGHPERGELVKPNDADALAEGLRKLARRRYEKAPLYEAPPSIWAAVFRELA